LRSRRRVENLRSRSSGAASRELLPQEREKGLSRSWNSCSGPSPFRVSGAAAGAWSGHSRPSISRRREMSMDKSLSRPKPPKAGAEGPPLQGFDHRRPSGAEIGGRPNFQPLA
jgi:hypothetical protein